MQIAGLPISWIDYGVEVHVKVGNEIDCEFNCDILEIMLCECQEF